MPSFLNKVFGRKRDDKPGSVSAHASKRQSNASLLEGKYEAVSPTVSPSATKFAEAGQQFRDKETSPLALFRSRSRNLTDQPRSSSAPASPMPHLTLNLPVPKEEKSRALGVVFEADSDNTSTLPEVVIGERRLNPLETLWLVKACSDNIIQSGLETLGLMHPHWYAASLDVQRKLVSLFILSVESKKRSPVTTLSPTPSSPSALFSTELEYTRSPHDVSAVLRWAIRHLRLEGLSFGSSPAAKGEWGWYVDFATRERDAGYAPNAFSQVLVPLLPPAHLQLLTATLDIISSLAAHAEVTGTSGSKLAKLFGLWLLATPRTKVNEDWSEFYTRWEHAGRILEHLFLAHVREESLTNKMPLRLSDLIKHYPYASQPASSTEGELPLLPPSRFSTRQYDALFVRIHTELPHPNSKRPTRDHPLRLISEAVKAAAAANASISVEPNSIWEDIKKCAAEDGQLGDTYPVLTRILDDETLRLLSLIPAEPSDKSETPTSVATSTASTSTSAATPILRSPQPRRRSSSVGAATGNGKASTNGDTSGHQRDSTAPAAFMNWNDFSVAGFGDSLLSQDFASTLETDVEVTTPPSSWTASRKRSGRSRSSTMDTPSLSPRPAETRGREGGPEEVSRKALLTRVDVVSVDEAFVDFWSDALLDPISASWPAFVVCQLRPGAWRVSLLVIEHTYSTPKPPPSPVPAPLAGDKRAASPRPSLSSNMSARKSFTFSPTKKRFSLFSTHDAGAKGVPRKGSRASGRSPRIGEMGEILPEEGPYSYSPPPVPAIPKARDTTILPVPVVVSSPIETSTPDHIEPVKTNDSTQERLLVNLPEGASAPVAAAAPGRDKALPPAPEPVVVTGDTPGPQVALNTSEPAALAQASMSADATAIQTFPDQSLPEISALPKVVESAPVDPPPESADAEPPVAQAPSGSHVASQAQNGALPESEKPGGDTVAAELNPEPSLNQGDTTHTVDTAPAVGGSSDSSQTQTPAEEPVPASANGGAAHAEGEPSPSNSDDTVVGSKPGPAYEGADEPSSPIDEIADPQRPAVDAPAALISASENEEASQDPQVPAHADADADASNADNNRTGAI